MSDYVRYAACVYVHARCICVSRLSSRRSVDANGYTAKVAAKRTFAGSHATSRERESIERAALVRARYIFAELTSRCTAIIQFSRCIESQNPPRDESANDNCRSRKIENESSDG